MKYYVSVTEISNKVVGVVANSAREAIAKAERAYDEGGITLDYSDIVETSIRTEFDQNFYREEEADGFSRWQTIE